MRAACCSVDITPPVGTPIGGNVRDDNISRGVHDPLYANILCLSNMEKTVVFIGLDLIVVTRSFTQDLKSTLEDNHGVAKENVVIFCTHTHSGPDVVEAFEDERPIEMKNYMQELVKKINNQISECLNNTWKATVGIGKGYEDSISFNRRIAMKDGTIQMNWEDIELDQVDKATGPIDPDVYVISVKDEANQIRSVIVNFTLHPAILVGKDWLISRDFVNSLTVKLQQQVNKDLVVLFANGAEGNINHIDIENKHQSRGFDEANRVGNILATKTLTILEDIDYHDDFTIRAISQTMNLPKRKITEKQVKEAKELLEKVNWKIPTLLDGVPKEMYAIEIIKLYEDPRQYLETELQIIQIGEALMVTLPGEFFVEFGLEIKEKLSFEHILIVGLANDFVGYVPTSKAFDEGGYEIKTARTSQLVPEAGDLVVSNVLEMTKNFLGR